MAVSGSDQSGAEQGKLERQVRAREAELYRTTGVGIDESFLELSATGIRVRLLGSGSGPPVLLLHGVTLSAAVWLPLFPQLPGYRLLAVDLPGHGLSDPVSYRPGHVREHTLQLIEDIFDALDLASAHVIGHSLGGMFALWHAAAAPQRFTKLVAVGDPAVALPGVTVRMPLTLMTVPGLGHAMLRSPAPAPLYRLLLARGLGRREAKAAPFPLIEALRLSARRPGNARTVASLMHALNQFRRPRPENVLTDAELQSITCPSMLVWGTQDGYLSPRDAQPSIAQMPQGTLHEVPGGHAPWLIDPGPTAQLIQTHLV